ncbi:MAG: hypothetical protein O3A72_02545 [Proteobacteria bacterium]|nr:hypothetical protein [Pseudomonadota bacterium]
MSQQFQTVLITSASYVNAELAAEFGRLPPAFLPFGHDRLFQRQIESIKVAAGGDDLRILLTLPASFTLAPWDAEWLDQAEIEILKLPDALSLAESIKSALILTDTRGPLRVLHGDTLFTGPLPTDLDVVSVAATTDAYDWGHLPSDETPEIAARRSLTGWFAFRSSAAFLKSLVRETDFTSALADYHRHFPMTEIDVEGWLDFGHLQTFYQARSKVSTARSFNALSISDHSVLKAGGKPGKLDAEAAWFEQAPPHLRLYFPAFLGRERNGYRLAYEVSPTLHELYVFGALEEHSWRQILAGCFDFLDVCAETIGSASTETDRDPITQLVTTKTLDRLEQWSDSRGVDLDQEWTYGNKPIPSLRRIADLTGSIAVESRAIPGVMHGDFCFPNVFYNFRQGLVKVIDPRGGIVDGHPNVFGDIRYDLAKLNHSLQGYDLILANRYEISRGGPYDLHIEIAPTNNKLDVFEVAKDFSVRNQKVNDAPITAMTVHMFLSMLPLHADRPDRQDAFLANALRLFHTMDCSA